MILKAGKLYLEDDTSQDAIFNVEDSILNIEDDKGSTYLTIEVNDFIAIAEAIKAEIRENILKEFILKKYSH